MLSSLSTQAQLCILCPRSSQSQFRSNAMWWMLVFYRRNIRRLSIRLYSIHIHWVFIISIIQFFSWLVCVCLSLFSRCEKLTVLRLRDKHTHKTESSTIMKSLHTDNLIVLCRVSCSAFRFSAIFCVCVHSIVRFLRLMHVPILKRNVRFFKRWKVSSVFLCPFSFVPVLRWFFK